MARQRTHDMVIAARASPEGIAHGLAPDEVREWLEWSGAKLLSMTLASPVPRGYKSNWPSFAQDASVAYGYTAERLRPAMPSGKEIQLMDEILLLPGLVNDITQRRIVNSRALVRPVANTHLYSWSKLAHMLGMDRRKVVRLYLSGINEIIDRVPQPQAYTIRQRLLVLRT